MRSTLRETGAGSGIFTAADRHFLLMSEVSCIWKTAGRSRRVHLLVSAPDFDAVDTMCETFEKLQNLESDGRPIFKVSAQTLFEIVRGADPRCEVIPAHVFTPWYGVFGAKSGFDTLGECFGDLAGEILAVETGLSSDPSMHWSIADSNSRAIVSFSDAHSTASLGREATVLDTSDMSYDAVMRCLRRTPCCRNLRVPPEHGKYHYDGHRKCGVRMHPDESAAVDSVCPVCDRPMTLGVLNRARSVSGDQAVRAYRHKSGILRDSSGAQSPFRHLVPLREILAYTLGVGKATKRVERVYDALIDAFGSEFAVLLDAAELDISAVVENEIIGRAIVEVRRGNVEVDPGYDGVLRFGDTPARQHRLSVKTSEHDLSGE